MNYKITESDVKNIKYAISAIEAETGDAFAEDECNGRRCFKHCGDRNSCLLRAKLVLGRIVANATRVKGGKCVKCPRVVAAEDALEKAGGEA